MADDGERPIRVLSFDGGGVRGLSSIIILDHIMRNINTQRKADGKQPLEPWQYFDLIGGTSTGGIIAIMLGRLRMSIDECIDAYTELSKTIFTPKHSRANPVRPVNFVNGDEKFDSKAFEDEIKTQVKNSKVANEDDQILLQDTNSPCKVCVVALHEEDSALAIFRTYDYAHASHTLFDECKVWEACRATSAAPTFFDPVQIGRFKQRFIDGGIGFNNPISQVYQEAQNMWPDRAIIVTSIGTGEVPGAKFGGNLKKIVESIKKIVTDCDKVANTFYKSNKTMVDEGRYFRFSVIHGLGDIGLEEYKNIPTIASRTQTYLATGEPEVKLKKCIEALLQEHDCQRSEGHSDFKSDTCLESLTFKEMNFRKENIVNANEDTCGWLLGNKNYASWIQSNDGLFWIQGKAGVGKSTLMKYIYEKIQIPPLDASSLKLSFFFHARGVELQKTPLGMFRSLLVQLYKGNSTARAEIRKEFNKNSVDGMVEIKWEWTEKMLEGLFSNVTCLLSGSKKVTIFVDALDEAGEAVANNLAFYLVTLYEKVQQVNGSVKICFSSRHYPIVSTRVADNQKVTVELENDLGIRSFLKSEFKKNVEDCGLTKSEEADNKLKEDIAREANGLFQWVCLVLKIIFKAYRSAKPPDYIKKLLYELPKDLNDLYQYILRDLLHQEQPAEILKLFRWVCFAARPLSVEEMRHAMAVFDSLPPSRVYKLKDSGEYVERDIETRITALSGGLIEVRAYGLGTVVQVTHQTVRDFLIESGFEILMGMECRSSEEKQQFEGSCHDILARLCTNYLWAEEVQQHSTATNVKGYLSKRTWIQLPSLETLPLLQYAVAALFWHASKAEQNKCYQDRLLEQFDYKCSRLFYNRTVEEGVFSLWCSAGKTYCARDYFGVIPSGGSTMLHIASMANIQSVVKILLKKKVKVGEKDELGQQAIHYAARGGAREVSETLIKSSHSVINAKDKNSVTPLQLAARHSRAEVMRLLITKKATIKCLYEENSTKLEEARGDVEKTISLLLVDAEKFNTQSLQSAAANGELGAVQLLLAGGTDVNAQGGEYGYALVAAAHNGRIAVMEVLLQNGAEIDTQSEGYGCALEIAAQISNDNMVKMLLSRGARFGDVLMHAVRMGHIRLVETLAKGGIDINVQIGPYGNALMVAIFYRRQEVAVLLLEKGAKTNTLSGQYTNALQLAAMSGDTAAVQTLLEFRAKYDLFLAAMVSYDLDTIIRSLGVVLLVATWMDRLDIIEEILAYKEQGDQIQTPRASVISLVLGESRVDAGYGTELAQYNGCTPLQLAVAANRPKAMDRFLAAGAHLNEDTSATGLTALQAAARNNNISIVERLLYAGANVNAPAAENDGRTALQAAAEHGNLDIVERLLAAGADVNATNTSWKGGGTALGAAASNGHLEVVTRLIAANANPNIGSYWTPLEEASMQGYYQIVVALLKAGADVDGADTGTTALEEAVEFRQPDIVEVLLEYGAHPNKSRGWFGRTPLKISIRNGDIEIETILRKAGAV